MKLSIVMMVKNEEKYLDKTLSSLNSIREQIDSELIILDTGSTDKTVEIAKKYTDKVYFSEWNNDFSDMRNKSISYAKGEWLLILDADEVVIIYNKLLDFFKTNKHKKYNCGTMELHNIMSINPIKKSNGQVPRLFKNIKGFEYTGIVHEQPKIIEPMYNNIITCEHYGYLFEDKKLKRRKLERNLKLLEKQLEIEKTKSIKETKLHYIHSHLAMTYKQMNRNSEALYHAQKAYDLVRNFGKKGKDSIVYAFQYQSYISVLCENFRIREAYDICLDYIKFDTKNIDILYYLSKISLKLDMPKDCIKYCNKYLYYIENYEESTSFQNTYVKCETLDRKDEIYKYLILSHVKLEKYKKTLDIIQESDFDKDIINTEQILCLYKTDNIDKVIKIYDEIKIGRKKRNFLRSIEKNIKTTFKSEDLEKIYDVLSKINDEDYSLFNKYRLDKQYNSKLDKILIQKNELYYYEIIELYMNNNKSLPELLKYMHNEKLETAFIYCIKNSFEFKFVLEDIILNLKNTLDINLIRIYKIITRVLLFNGQLFEENYNKIFDLYIMYNKLYDKIINKTKENNGLLCDITSFEQMFMKELDDLKNLKDNVLYIKKLKNLAIDYPNHKKSIDYLKELFEKNIDETDEVKVLKKEFINMISNNISKDNTQQIETLLEQYKELYGIDKEILNIYGILDIYKEELDSAEINFKKALSLDIYNADTLYNIAYLKELKKEFKETKLFYEFCRENTDEQDLINICNEKIDCLNNY